MKIKLLGKNHFELNDELIEIENYSSETLWKTCVQKGVEAKALAFQRMIGCNNISYSPFSAKLPDGYWSVETKTLIPNGTNLRVESIPETLNVDPWSMTQTKLEQHSDKCFEYGKDCFTHTIREFLGL